MKKKTNICLYVVFTLMGMLDFLHAEEVTVRVLDEQKNPIEGASVEVWFVAHTAAEDVKSSGFSDREGKYVGRGHAPRRIEIDAFKDGWYMSTVKSLRRDSNHSVTLILRKLEKQVPLYVRKVRLEFPTFDKWLGFDFEAGDWVAPHGRGKSRDIVFKFHRDYMGSKYSAKRLEEVVEISKRFAERRKEKWDPETFRLQTAKWKSKFQMAFSSKLEGIVEEKGGYLTYSKMKMPHKAPEKGYENEEVVTRTKSYKSKDSKAEMEELRKYIKLGDPKPAGYYIRTRVQEVNGKIIKANYVKLPQAIKVEAKGVIEFMYYFNPSPNDRNLEFDPKANLATEQKRAYDP